MRPLILIGLIMLAACSPPEFLRPDAGPHESSPGPNVLAASEHSILISPVGSPGDSRAKALASEHCRQFGFAAIVSRMINRKTVLYLCLPHGG